MNQENNTNFSFDLPKNRSNVIKVIGVGGGGSNAINYMFQQGIVDPAKVTIAVVESGASIASLALTTETLVADEEEEKPAAAAPDMSGMGGMGGMGGMM